ncbi:MAG: Phosphoglycolate phosphatase [Desulfovibrio sp.]
MNCPPTALTGLIFDCDGVLFDSKEANTAYYNHIRFAVQLPPMTEEEATYSHMASTDEALERMIPDELKIKALEARNQTKYRDTFMALMQPAPYMIEFLRHMKAKNVPLALCTNRSDSVLHVLEHFALAEFFSPVMTISHARPKPDPQGLLKILEEWKMPPENVAFLGDSLVDQLAATAAGVPFWSFNNPDLSADLHVSAFKELDELLELLFTR